jgi:gamma-glutamylcyclotransferase (GGCT)/AIG2-like uncharacterized protein YtfP
LRYSVSHFPNLPSDFVGEAITKEKYPLVFDRLPYLLHKPGRGLHIKGIVFEIVIDVVGEVYKVSREYLGHLDRFEGAPNFYFRKEIGLQTPIDGTVYAYFKTQVDDHLLSLPFIEDYVE